MIQLLLAVYVHLPFYNLMVGSSGMVIGQYGPLCYWSIRHHQVHDQLAFIVLSCSTVGTPAVISNFLSTSIHHVFPASIIPLHLPCWIPSFAVGVEVLSNDSAALSNDSQQGQLSCRSLPRLPVPLIVNIDYPRYPLPSSPEVSSHYIIIITAA